MSEYSITPVSVASLDMPSQVQQVATAPVKGKEANVEEVARQVSPEDKASKEILKTKRQTSNVQYTDVHLKFQVDNETNEITVLILDKISKEVIRTIPPEELSNLRAGDLFELFM